MALQNRVAPDGSLHHNSAYGMFTGNRGSIHDPDTKQLSGRRWTTNAWICCSLEWKGKRRDVWGRNYLRRDGSLGAGWSELFFLDEVTALAAGHRPCHTCRREDAVRFHHAFCRSNKHPEEGNNSISKNRILHRQRWQSSREKPQRLERDEVENLPDGTVVKAGDDFLAVKSGSLLPWHFDGYGTPRKTGSLSGIQTLLVTPDAIIGVLRAGYEPVWHSSAS